MMEEIYSQLRHLKKRAAFSVAILLISLVALVITFWKWGAWGFIFVGTAVISGIFSAITTKKYTACFKENIVRGALQEVFTDLVFEPKRGLPSDVVFGTGMVQIGNRYSSNDLITGRYKGVNFTQSDVEIEEETSDSDGGSSSTTLFKGRWMIFEFNKDFRCDMQVVSRWFAGSRRKGGLFTKKEDKLDRLKFENEEFNKEFKVFAQDEQEAFYIMTPHMMESLLKLRREVKAPVMFMFVGGVLHIAVHNGKDAFEAKLFGKLDPETERQRILADIRVITDFVDDMELDRDLYKV